MLSTVAKASGRATAVQIAKRALAQGMPAVGLLDTRRFSSLTPGFFLVFSGEYTSNGDAAAQVSQARRAGFASAYAVHVAR